MGEPVSGQMNQAMSTTPATMSVEPALQQALTHHRAGRLPEAEAGYRRALEIKPDFAEAHNNLGAIFSDQGRLSEAEASYRRALEFEPDYEDAFGNLLFALNYHPDKGAQEIFAGYREYDQRFGLPHRSAWRAHANSRQRGRRLT